MMSTEMSVIGRRAALRLATGTLLANTVAATEIAGAADSAAAKPAGNRLQRYPAKYFGRGPLISSAVAHGDVVYVSGVIANVISMLKKLNCGVREQTKLVLDDIDERLAQAGTNKSNILVAQVWLTDMSELADHNEIWNAWVDPSNLPARVCVQSPRLAGPQLLRVEIKVTAARPA